MPVGNFPSKEYEDLEKNLIPWMMEFQVRPEGTLGKWNVAAKAAQDVDSSLDEVIEILRSQEDVSGERLPVMNLTRENLNKMYRQPYLEDVAETVVDFLDGFIPNQSLGKPLTNTVRSRNGNDDLAGDYMFRHDNAGIVPKQGHILQGSSVVELLGHEGLHKNNQELIVPNPSRVREYANIFTDDDFPDYFEQILSENGVVPKDYALAGGLVLSGLDRHYGNDPIEYQFWNGPGNIDYESLEQDFRNQSPFYVDYFNLDGFDVRDEAICQAFSFLMYGAFEDEEKFEKEAKGVVNFYNERDSYSEDAGTEVVESLMRIRNRINEYDGSVGESFRHVMDDREAFLRGEETFHKYSID